MGLLCDHISLVSRCYAIRGTCPAHSVSWCVGGGGDF
jgi:hypothetical protein